jgi:hypothetical protein
MTRMPSPQYNVRAGDPTLDRDAVLSAWRGHLGHEDQIAAKYDWFYLACPHGPPLLQLLSADASNDCLGTACAGYRRMRLQGEDMRAGVLVDLVVLPEHRSLGPALMLQQGLIAASSESLDVLYGFPNPKAVALCKRVGYQHLTDLVRYVRVLRHGRYLHARLPNWLIWPAGWLLDTVSALRDGWQQLRGPHLRHEWRKCADARMDDLWRNSPQGNSMIGVRDMQHAQWRFDQSPLATTLYLWVIFKDQAQAWFAVQAKDGVLHVRDFWSCDGTRGMSRRHVFALLSAARAAGYTSVSTEISGDEAQLQGWKDCRFSARNKRPVFARWNRAMTNEPKWFLTAADEDE